ncbi:MAG: 4Fe-4S dicluster domain-containing protein [Thermoplasmatota archaeon]
MSEKKENKKPTAKCYQVKHKNKEGAVCVITERCKGCGFCIEFCPVNALEYSEETTEKGYHPPKMTKGCILCGKCERVCPEFAIYIKEKEEKNEEEEYIEENERGEWI